MEELTIRPATNEDLDDCVKLMEHTNLAYASGDFPDKEYIKDFVDGENFFVATFEGKIVGLVCGEVIKSGGFLFHYLIANRDFKKQRVGEGLMKHLFEYLQSKNFQFVLGYASANDEKLINLYKKKYKCFVGKTVREIVKIL